MITGERRGSVAQALVSTFLVLAAILSALVPFANGMNPATAAARAPLPVSERGFGDPVQGSALSSTPVVASATPPGLNFDYLVAILLENKGICEILTSCGGSAPYLTSLASASALALNYQQCTAPSLPNYLCLTAASSFGCTVNAPPHSNACTNAAWNATNLVDRFEAANLTWKAYLESMPSNCYSGNTSLYAVKHNPFVYYESVATNASRCARVIPSGPANQALLGDLNSTATASNFMWFTPNLCHDMHDCNVTAGDVFLSNLVPQILNSPVFQTQRAALLITFDEHSGGAGAPYIYTVWTGPTAKNGFQSSLAYDHFSALRTIEANWNLTPLNANDSAATPMTDFFFGLPSARFVIDPPWPQPGTSVAFNASSSSSNGPNATLQYRWDWTNDGTWDTAWSTAPTADHVFGAPGVFTAALEVLDSRGLVDKTTRGVSVDGVAPVTTSNLSGTQGANGWYIGNVTVTLNATDDLSGVAWTTYHLDGSGSLPYTDPIAVSADGDHTVTYRSADEAGNLEAHQNMTFRKDGTAPVTARTLSGTLVGNTFVTPILVALAPSDATSGVAGTPVQVDGGPVTNYTLPFIVSNVGLHSVQYYSIDAAGNVEPTNSFAVTNGTITDIALLTEALLNGTVGSSGWYTSSVAVTLLLVNGTSPPDSIWYRLDDGAWTPYSQPFAVNGDGVHSLDFNATNGAGLNEAVHHASIPIDTTAPASTSAASGTLGNNGWYVSQATVSLNATDDTSGVASISYQIDGGAWFLYAAPFPLNEGLHAVGYFATDLAGLPEPTYSLIVAVDTTPPATTGDLSGVIGNNDWYIIGVTVFLNTSDATSGVASIEYQVDGGGWTSYSGPFGVYDGVHLIEYRATDVAGLVEGVGTRSVAVDTVPPTTTAALSGRIGANGWYLSDVTVFLNASDLTSGLANLSYRVDGGSWLVYGGPFVLSDGQHLVEYFASDLAGLSETMKSQTIAIDTTAPATTATIAGTPGTNGWYTSNAVVSLAASDPESGVANIYYRIDGGPWAVYSSPVILTDGTHVLEYYAVNNAGFTETTHSTTIAVDTAPPTTASSVSGTAGANGWFVSLVTVSLNASDATSGVANMSYRVDGGAWQVYAGPFVLSEGQHVVEYFSTDQAGLVEATDSRSIAIDTTPPATSAGLSGTGGNNGWYVSNVTVSLSASDSGSGIANVFVRIDGGTWMAYSGPVTLTDGTHVVEYYAVDVAGLVEATHSTVIAVDTTAPATTISQSGTPGSNGWYTSNVTVTLSPSDSTSGVAITSYRVDGGAWLVYAGPFTLGEGQHTVDFSSSDFAGLTEPMQSQTLSIDTTPPATTAAIAGTAGASGWYTSNVVVNLVAIDSMSGIANVYARIDGGPWTTYSSPITVADGAHVLEYYAINGAGLTETTHSLTILVDTAPPATDSALSGTTGTNGWYTSNVTVSLPASDGTSGVASVTYRIDSGPWLSYAGPFLLGDGQHVVQYGASDVAGNLETIHSVNIAIDSSPPATALAFSGSLGANGWYVTSVSATMTATDETSGVANIFYRIDGGPWAVYSRALTLDEGRHLIEYRATDLAGNIEQDRSTSLWIDTTAPVTSAVLAGSLGDNGWYRSNVTASLGASDATSGVAQISYRVDNASWLVYAGPFLLTNGEHWLEYSATDVAGLPEATRSISVRINTIAPITEASVSGSLGSNGWYISEVSVTLNSSDGTGGVDNIFYRIDGGAWIVYSGPFVLGDGRRTFEYYATDRTGNLEPGHLKTLTIDTTAPTASAISLGTAGENSWYVSDVSMTLQAADATSGLAEIRVRVDAGSWHPYGAPIPLGPGRHSVEFYAIDRAGLLGAIETRMIDIDIDGPVTVDSAAGTAGTNGWYVSEVTITLTSSDALSGVASTQYRIDGGTWIAYAGPFLISKGGNHLLEFASVDVAGNRGPVALDYLNVDTSKPYFTSLSASANSTASPLRITWSAADNDSGIAEYEIRVDDGPFESVGTATSVTLILTDGPHVIQVRAMDNAGLSTIRSLSIQVLSSSAAPSGSLFLVIGVLAGGPLVATAFRAWQSRRRANGKND